MMYLCYRSLVRYVTWILTFVDVEGDGTHSNAHHAFGVVEKFDGFRVECKVVGVLKTEKEDWNLCFCKKPGYQQV